jgi:hypothetical protein
MGGQIKSAGVIYDISIEMERDAFKGKLDFN